MECDVVDGFPPPLCGGGKEIYRLRFFCCICFGFGDDTKDSQPLCDNRKDFDGRARYPTTPKFEIKSQSLEDN